MKTICRACGLPYQKDKRNVCNKCRSTAISKKRGSKTRDLLTDPIQARSRAAEVLVGKVFKAIGFTVALTERTGPDVVATLGDKKITIEVKMAIAKKEPGCWFVQGVSKYRQNDDLIAIVFENQLIHIEKMSEHLSKCGKSGLRAVASLIRERAWVGAPECSDENKKIAGMAVGRAGIKHGKYSNKFGLI